jgi:helix-turn-helix protein
MPDSPLADFVGAFDVETAEWDGRTRGRVLLNSSQLVFAADGERERVRTADIFDVNAGAAPRALDPVPETPLTIAYETGGQRSVAVIGAGEPTVEKFERVLFRVLLNDRSVLVKHPARVGGRVTDAAFRPAKLELSGGGVQLRTSEGATTIEYASVTEFSRRAREVRGETRPTLTIGHVEDGVGTTTQVATETTRASSLLGRCLRQRYDELLASLDDVDLSERDVEALNTIYTIGGSPRQLVSVLGERPEQVKRLLGDLGTDGLLRRGADGVELTTKGQVVVNHYMARVNE